MTKWDLTCFDLGNGKHIVLGSFLDESVANKALEYVENSEEYADLDYTDFKLSRGTLFKTLGEFLED